MRTFILLTVFAGSFAIALWLLATFFPFKKDELPPVPPTVTAPAVEQLPKFLVGDSVIVDGLTDMEGNIPIGKVVEVQGMALWMDLQSGQQVESRAYLIEFIVGGNIEQLNVPEILIKKS